MRRYVFREGEEPREWIGRVDLSLATAFFISPSMRLFWYLRAAQVPLLDGSDVTQ